MDSIKYEYIAEEYDSNGKSNSCVSELKENMRPMCMYVKTGSVCSHMLEVFRRVREAGLTCKLSNCHFPQQKVEYLRDKKKLEQNYKFSKMCKSVGSDKPCVNPKGQCKFAHSFDQLQIVVCGFGDKCRRVYWNTTGVCLNRGDNVCNFKHPSETKENFKSRTALKRLVFEGRNVQVKSKRFAENDIRPLVRCFIDEEDLFDNDPVVVVSDYKPHDVLNFLMLLKQNNQINEDDYIFGPLYANKGKGEFQLAITGKCKFNETLQHGLHREVGEEVGLYINRPQCLRNQTQVDKHTFFSCNINDTINITRDIYTGEYIPSYPYKNERDDYYSKVGCILYGNKNSVRNYMRETIVQWDNEDRIIGVAAVSVREAILILEDKINRDSVYRNLCPVMVSPVVGLVEDPIDTIEQLLSSLGLSDIPTNPVLKRQSNILF